jgi:hypothetical protein
MEIIIKSTIDIPYWHFNYYDTHKNNQWLSIPNLLEYLTYLTDFVICHNKSKQTIEIIMSVIKKTRRYIF